MEEPPKASKEKDRPAEESPSRGADGKKPVDPENLSPEEQMAKYEEDLKENDWGHQPC